MELRDYHAAAAEAHRAAAIKPNDEKNDRAYSATWRATDGNHPDSVDTDLEETFDTNKDVAAHTRLAEWHDSQAQIPSAKECAQHRVQSAYDRVEEDMY